MRRYLICDCGNRDEDDVPVANLALPPCSAECGRIMRIDAARQLRAHYALLEKLAALAAQMREHSANSVAPIGERAISLKYANKLDALLRDHL